MADTGLPHSFRSTPLRRFGRAVAVLLAAALGWMNVTSAHAAQIWLAGVDPVVRRTIQPEITSDYMDLFRSDAPWSAAAANVQVIKISTQFVLSGSDEELLQVFGALKRRKIAFALEAGLLSGRGGCGVGIEGYAAPGVIGAAAGRVKRLGGELSYVAMDEPVWFGNHYSGPRACHSSLQEIARDVAGKVAAVRRSFPNVVVGDIEPYAAEDRPADWLDELKQWFAAYRAATGEPLAFFDVDMDWHKDWRPQLSALVPTLKASGIKFGIIYDGDGGDTSGVTWTRHAEERFAAVEADPALAPDQAILQTWMRHPAHMLPESQPGTMTWLVNRYAAAETHLTVQRTGDRLEGQLTGPDGTPLPGQHVEVMAEDTRNGGLPAERALSGTVPADADNALLILRINAECGCSGPVNVTLGPARYRDDRTGQEVVRAFTVPGVAEAGGRMHITGAAGQTFRANSAPWAVRPGDPWTLHIPVGAAAASAHSGYAALVFRRKDMHEAWRIPLWFAPASQRLAEVTTDADGRFLLAPKSPASIPNPAFRIEFGGTASYRPSASTVP